MIFKEVIYKNGVIYYKGVNTHLTNELLFDIAYQTTLKPTEIIQKYYREYIKIHRNDKINSILNDQTQNN